MESPDKINSLDRQKKSGPLLNAINDLDQAVYGGSNTYGTTSGYDSYVQARRSPSTTSPVYKTAPYGTSTFQSSSSGSPSHYASLNAPKSFGTLTNTSPKPFGTSPQPSKQNTIESTTRTFKPPTLTGDYKSGSDGYTSSEYTTNTYKTPEGYRTDSYKYEYYQSEPKTTYSSTTEKYYTSTNAKDDKSNVITSPLIPKSTFETFKNGGGTDEQYQSSYSSNVEFINEPPVLKDNDTLEQRMLKKSINEQIFEKKTTTTSRTTKQESQMKTFKFQ